jgi:hypothetical protein
LSGSQLMLLPATMAGAAITGAGAGEIEAAELEAFPGKNPQRLGWLVYCAELGPTDLLPCSKHKPNDQGQAL